MAQNIQIFPHEIVQNSVEKHFQEYNPRNRVIYLSILALFFVALLLLFIIRVDVTVRSAGSIRSVQERTDIRTPVNGVVDSVFITENSHVEAGQLLIKIHANAVEEKSRAVQNQYRELNAQLADLKMLVAGKDTGLQSSLYQQQVNAYQQATKDARLKVDLAQRAYGRYSKLYKQRAISAAEFEQFEFDLKDAQSDLHLLEERQLSQWQGDLTRLELQQKEVAAQQTAYQEEEDLYAIRAAVSGTVQKLKSVTPGAFISPNELIGEISPDSGLIAETYVNTRDIGMLRKNADVRMQVDAYDYNVWGTLKGKILSISEDVFVDNGVPYFKVRCMLDKTVMKLKNGYEGTLKKGMTVQARFTVTRRSLFQLLYDTTDDWLNPTTIKPKKTT